jgi:hypothetical protein
MIRVMKKTRHVTPAQESKPMPVLYAVVSKPEHPVYVTLKVGIAEVQIVAAKARENDREDETPDDPPFIDLVLVGHDVCCLLRSLRYYTM